MKILFTGASGFLGTNIIPYLNKSYSIETVGLLDSDTITCNLALEVPSVIDSFE